MSGYILKLVKSVLLHIVLFVCKRLSHPFIIGEDFMKKHYMSLQWVPENKCALGFQGETIAVASQAILDEPLRLRNAIRIPPRSIVMAPGYCNQMFNGKATAMPCTELKQRFPNPVHGTYANE